MAHETNNPEETSEPGPEPGQEAAQKQESGPLRESVQTSVPGQKQGSGAPSGQWEDPPGAPHPSGFNPDYWPKY